MTTEFRTAAARALADAPLRANIRRAMDGLQAKRRDAFPDPDERERLRDTGAAIRGESVARLPELLEELERTCTAN